VQKVGSFNAIELFYDPQVSLIKISFLVNHSLLCLRYQTLTFVPLRLNKLGVCGASVLAFEEWWPVVCNTIAVHERAFATDRNAPAAAVQLLPLSAGK
jgi:hypothetical protein